jgi:predicted transposase/invertase (TIGR01784 family)
MTPPHKDFKEKLTIRSDKERTDWLMKWEIIAVYPRCIKEEHLRQKSLDALEEWLLLDVVTDTKEAKRIKELVHTKEVQEAFEQLDISGLTDEEIEELEFQEAIADRYKTSYEKRIQETKVQTEKEKALEIAQRMLTAGIAIRTIHQTTGLSESEIEQLRTE